MASPSGTIQRIHAALAEQDMTARQLGTAIDRTPRQVSNAIQSAKRTMGAGKNYVPVYIIGYLREDGLRQPIYSLTKPARDVSQKVMVHPRYVPEFKPLTVSDYDIWSHKRMAVEGR